MIGWNFYDLPHCKVPNKYNGFLFGVMMFSILRICQERYIEGCVWFATLLNLKHIYLYVAPAYAVYILRNYCFTNRGGKNWLLTFSPLRFLCAVAAGLSVFLLSFGPFIVKNQLFVVLARLFPFKRGLCHAYWAPNFWALYNIADKVLAFAGVRLQLIGHSNVSTASMTGGLVQEYEHSILPSIRPIHTLLLTALAIVPALLHTWRYASSSKQFIRCIAMCSYGAFMFGWHVHEKAILLMIIPLTRVGCLKMAVSVRRSYVPLFMTAGGSWNRLLATDKKQDAGLFLLLSTVGHYSLFPLIFTMAETFIKYALFLLYVLYAFHCLGALHRDSGRWCRLPLLSVIETLYIFGLLIVEIYCQGVHPLLGLDRSLPFLPLMIISVYCAIGITYIWLKAYWTMFTVGFK